MRPQESEVWCFKLSFSTGCTKRNSAAIRSLLKKAFNRGLRLRLTKALPMESMWKENYVTTKQPKRGTEPLLFSRNCKGYWSDTFLTALPSEVRGFKSGGGALPYISRICMCRPKGKGFCAVGLKTGIDFAHLGLESGTVLEGTRRSVWTNSLFQFQMS